MVMVTDPAHFGPGMLKLLGTKPQLQQVSNMNLGQVSFLKIPIFLGYIILHRRFT